MTPGLVSFGTKGTVHVAIVEKPEEQAKGLSGKMSLPPDEGMLFWFGTRGDWAFVMKNTLIPLDILFLDFGQVVGIITLQPNDSRSASHWPALLERPRDQCRMKRAPRRCGR